jgi:hypothetical protein
MPADVEFLNDEVAGCRDGKAEEEVGVREELILVIAGLRHSIPSESSSIEDAVGDA